MSDFLASLGVIMLVIAFYMIDFIVDYRCILSSLSDYSIARMIEFYERFNDRFRKTSFS